MSEEVTRHWNKGREDKRLGDQRFHWFCIFPFSLYSAIWNGSSFTEISLLTHFNKLMSRQQSYLGTVSQPDTAVQITMIIIWTITDKDICSFLFSEAVSKGCRIKRCILAWKTESVMLFEYCYNMQWILKLEIWNNNNNKPVTHLSWRLLWWTWETAVLKDQ